VHLAVSQILLGAFVNNIKKISSISLHFSIPTRHLFISQIDVVVLLLSSGLDHGA